MNILSVAQAVIQLKKAKVISNDEVFRRWLRDGKVEGAYIESKRKGWQIPEESIEKIITIHTEKSSNKEISIFEKGFKDGYAAAQREFKEKIPKLMIRGAYDVSFSLQRAEFQEMTSFSKHKKQEFLAFADERIFKRGVKNPRSNISVQFLEGWFAFGQGPLIIFGPDYNYDRDLTLEHQAIALLVEYLRLEFIATNKNEGSV